jgi:hypothetical protein
MKNEKKKPNKYSQSALRVKGLLKEKKALSKPLEAKGAIKPLKQCGMINIPLSCLETSKNLIKGENKPKKRATLKATVTKEALRYALFAVLRGVLRKSFAEKHVINAKRVTPAPGRKSILLWKNTGEKNREKNEGEKSLQSHEVSPYAEEPLFEESELEDYNQWEDALKVGTNRRFHIGRITHD